MLISLKNSGEMDECRGGTVELCIGEATCSTYGTKKSRRDPSQRSLEGNTSLPLPQQLVHMAHGPIRNHGCSGNAVVITRRFPISWNLTKVENKGEPSSHVPSISPFAEYIFFLGHSISPTLLKSQAQTQTTLCVLYPDSSILLVQQII